MHTTVSNHITHPEPRRRVILGNVSGPQHGTTHVSPCNGVRHVPEPAASNTQPGTAPKVKHLSDIITQTVGNPRLQALIRRGRRRWRAEPPTWGGVVLAQRFAHLGQCKNERKEAKTGRNGNGGGGGASVSSDGKRLQPRETIHTAPVAVTHRRRWAPNGIAILMPTNAGRAGGRTVKSLRPALRGYNRRSASDGSTMDES